MAFWPDQRGGGGGGGGGSTAGMYIQGIHAGQVAVKGSSIIHTLKDIYMCLYDMLSFWGIAMARCL